METFRTVNEKALWTNLIFQPLPVTQIKSENQLQNDFA